MKDRDAAGTWECLELGSISRTLSLPLSTFSPWIWTSFSHRNAVWPPPLCKTYSYWIGQILNPVALLTIKSYTDGFFSTNCNNPKKGPLWLSFGHITTYRPTDYGQGTRGYGHDIYDISSDSFEDIRVENLGRASYKKSENHGKTISYRLIVIDILPYVKYLPNNLFIQVLKDKGRPLHIFFAKIICKIYLNQFWETGKNNNEIILKYIWHILYKMTISK